MAAVSERDALAKVASAQLAAISADLAEAEAEIAARSAEITISAERHAVEVEEGAERGGGACGMAGGSRPVAESDAEGSAAVEGMVGGGGSVDDLRTDTKLHVELEIARRLMVEARESADEAEAAAAAARAAAAREADGQRRARRELVEVRLIN